MSKELVAVEAIGQRVVVGVTVFKRTPEYQYPVAMLPADTAKAFVENMNFRYADPIKAAPQQQPPAEAPAPQPKERKKRKPRTRRAK